MTGKAAIAPVNRVVPLSTVDGPGARSTIFLQGCNIACLYCHNPETQQLCRHCGQCVAVCPADALTMKNGKVMWNEAACIGCDACQKICPYNATPKIHWMAAAQVMEAIRPNLPFIRGITVSGGECTLYPAFLEELFQQAHKQGLTCLMDSNGMVDFQQLSGLMAVTDGVMLDVKAWDTAVYQTLTGVADNSPVKRNLAWLYQVGKLPEVRVVYMPGYVDAKAAVEGIASILGAGVQTVKLKLIAFRCHGVRGVAEQTREPEKNEMESLNNLAEKLGFLHIQLV